MKHAWGGYRKCGWGADEYKPNSCKGVPGRWGGIGMNLLDGMDTLLLMGMDSDFRAATDWVSASLHFERAGSGASVFETTIRALGGLLSAYSLSKEPILLTKATDLGERILKTMGGPHGLPCATMSLASPSAQCGGLLGLAELGTVQLELRELSAATKQPKFAVAANRVYAWAAKAPQARTGLFGVGVDRQSGANSGEVTFGGNGDSFFEYLLKGWLQGGKREPKLRALYDRAIQGMRGSLLKKTSSGVSYVGTTAEPGKMEHLACFLPGLLALGAHTAPPGSSTAKPDMDLARELMATCYAMDSTTAVGLAPERVNFRANGFEVAGAAPWTVHRPETIESLYVLAVTTGEQKYRDWGWALFAAMEKCCKTKEGYGAHPDVRNAKLKCCEGNDDRTETYFFAETLKYLYLLFTDKDANRLETSVFNTEAHPFPVRSGQGDFPLFE